MIASRMTRRSLLASVAAVALIRPGHAADPGDPIRKLVIVCAAQASDPQEFQAAQLLAQSLAPTRHHDRSAPDAAAAACRLGLEHARKMGHGDVAHGRPARAQRPGRFRLQSVQSGYRCHRIRFRRPTTIQTT